MSEIVLSHAPDWDIVQKLVLLYAEQSPDAPGPDVPWFDVDAYENSHPSDEPMAGHFRHHHILYKKVFWKRHWDLVLNIELNGPFVSNIHNILLRPHSPLAY